MDRKVEQLESDLVGLDNPAAVEVAVAHLEERGYHDVLRVTEPYDGTRSLRELKCNLFEDGGLIALDDLDWYRLVGSGITAFAQPTEEIGASAFECLLKRLRGDDGPARLIVRGATLGNLR